MGHAIAPPGSTSSVYKKFSLFKWNRLWHAPQTQQMYALKLIDSTIDVCGVNLIESISTPVKVKNILDQVGLSM